MTRFSMPGSVSEKETLVLDDLDTPANPVLQARKDHCEGMLESVRYDGRVPLVVRHTTPDLKSLSSPS